MKTISVNDGRQNYLLAITTDDSLDLPSRKQKNLRKAGECFAHAAFLARWELCQGLVRGGVPYEEAVQSPHAYFDQVFQYFQQLTWFLEVPKSFRETPLVPSRWETLMRWKPDPDRFFLWFGVKWDELPEAGPQEMKQSFRRTILGTLLGLVGNQRHSLHLNTGESGTLGFSKPAHASRYWLNLPSYADPLPYSVLDGWISRREDLYGLFRVHPYCLQQFALGLVHVHKRQSPTVIKIKRPTKMHKWESSEWKTRWCHTLFHEASHHYGMTMDYFYLQWDPSALEIYTSCPPDCQRDLYRAFDGEVPASKHAFRQTYASFLDEGASAQLPLANADSVAAYLMGYRSADEYVMARASQI